MSSGGKGRSNKGPKGGTDRSTGGGTSTHTHQTKSDHNHNEKDKEPNPHKIAPTAEQLRIAQMIDNTHPEKVLQEKINQVSIQRSKELLYKLGSYLEIKLLHDVFE